MQDQLAKSGRSPIAEIAAMADMMNIQLVDQIDKYTKKHTKYQNNCNTKKADYSTTIAKEANTENVELEDGETKRQSWISKLPRLPELDSEMKKKQGQIAHSEDAMAAAIAKRAAQHKAYLKALTEHDKALADVRAIRLIIQNSNLDNRAKVSATNSAGAKSAATPVVKKLVEMKSEIHPRLTNLVELSSKALQSDMSGGSAVDLIYKLIYQTRDQLIQSKNKLIKNEQAANANWRTNKIAFRNDINDLHILKMTYYKEKGTTKMLIGNDKVVEGQHKQVMSKAVKVKEDTQIEKNFLVAACDEEQRIYAVELARMRSELKSIKLVQKKLSELNWSPKVFKSVSAITEKITYFNKDVKYDIRSALGRYMIMDDKGQALFKPVGKQVKATDMKIIMDPETMKYTIAPVHPPKGSKNKHWTLQEEDNKVFFTQKVLTDKSNYWEFVFDAENSKNFFIKNVKSENTLYLSPGKNSWSLTTAKQSTDKNSQFLIEYSDFLAVGCYKDKINNNLQFYAGASNSQGPRQCFSECEKAVAAKKVKSYTHFGLSNGNQCYCGDKWNQEIAGSIGECNRLNKNGEIVGGSMRSYIYEVTKEGKNVYIKAPPSKVPVKK